MARPDRTALDNALVNGVEEQYLRPGDRRRLARATRSKRILKREQQLEKPIEQAQSQYFIPAVEPGAATTIKLAGGKYCLGTESTVPFISLSGGGMSQKLISWGEMVEVPPGQLVTIKNESFHRGDIAINSGWDFGIRPAKITVPFTLLDEATGLPVPPNPGAAFTAVPEFPLDTRLARRAYLVPDLITTAAGATFNITGIQVKHSFPSSQNLTNRYQVSRTVPAFTATDPVALGGGTFGTYPIGVPHALTDQVTFLIDIVGFALFGFEPIWFYVVEYG